jgi:hypothetical protein
LMRDEKERFNSFDKFCARLVRTGGDGYLGLEFSTVTDAVIGVFLSYSPNPAILSIK